MTPSRATPKKTSFCRDAFWNGFASPGWAVQTLPGVILESICFMPIYADLAGLPPIQVYYGDHEVLVGEIVEFAKRAKDAGVDVGLHSVSEGQHNFIFGAGRVPEVDDAIEQMGQWLLSRLWPHVTLRAM